MKRHKKNEEKSIPETSVKYLKEGYYICMDDKEIQMRAIFFENLAKIIVEENQIAENVSCHGCSWERGEFMPDGELPNAQAPMSDHSCSLLNDSKQLWIDNREIVSVYIKEKTEKN